MYENDYTNEELIEMLKNGNIVQKQIAALRLEKINSKEEAQVLLQKLTGQVGKIREAVSLNLNEFMSNPKFLDYFKSIENYNVFLDFVMDDAVDKEATYLRIYPAQVYPQNRTVGICGVNFEVFSHSKIDHLSNYTTRIDTIVAALIETLNGQDIGTIGSLYFDAKSRTGIPASPNASLNPVTNTVFKCSLREETSLCRDPICDKSSSSSGEASALSLSPKREQPDKENIAAQHRKPDITFLISIINRPSL